MNSPRRFLPGSAGGWILALSLAIGSLAAPGQTTTVNAPPTDASALLLFPTNQALLPGKGPIPKWKPFPKLWAQRRAEFARHREQDHGAVVFLGDSITQGWNDLAATFPELKAANRGIGGDVTRGVLFRLREDVLDLDPAAVVLLIGINDIGNGGNPKDIASNIRMILAELEESNPRLPIVVCKVMPSKKDVRRKIQQLNSLLDEIIREDRRLIPCDTWGIFAAGDGTCYNGEFPDRLHPNKVGYAKWAAELKPIFAGLDLKRE